LVIQLHPLSTGRLNVAIGGTARPGCSTGGSCRYQMRRGDTVVLDPVDFVLTWSGTPCADTPTSDPCVFTAGDSDELALVVLHRR
jgi:hypothetical protein